MVVFAHIRHLVAPMILSIANVRGTVTPLVEDGEVPGAKVESQTTRPKFLA